MQHIQLSTTSPVVSALTEMLKRHRDCGLIVWAAREARKLAEAHSEPGGLKVEEIKELIVRSALAQGIPVHSEIDN